MWNGGMPCSSKVGGLIGVGTAKSETDVDLVLGSTAVLAGGLRCPTVSRDPAGYDADLVIGFDVCVGTERVPIEMRACSVNSRRCGTVKAAQRPALESKRSIAERISAAAAALEMLCPRMPVRKVQVSARVCTKVRKLQLTLNAVDQPGCLVHGQSLRNKTNDARHVLNRLSRIFELKGTAFGESNEAFELLAGKVSAAATGPPRWCRRGSGDSCRENLAEELLIAGMDEADGPTAEPSIVAVADQTHGRFPRAAFDEASIAGLAVAHVDRNMDSLSDKVV